MTQQILADKIGVSRQTINSIKAKRYVSFTVLSLKISTIFQVSVNKILKVEKDD